MNRQSVVQDFNHHINHQNLKGLASLMHEDYCFIDTTGHREEGRETGLESWQRLFKSR